MKRTNQGGSILGFVIVGAVMALLLVGGAYVVRHTLMPADTDRTSVAEKDKSTSSDDTKQDTAADPKDDTKDTPQDAGKKPDEITNQPSATTPAPQSTVEDTHTLPTTGPSDGIMSGLLLSSLVGVVAIYVRSRRASL